MDRLSQFLSHFPIRADVFHIGALTSAAKFHDDHGHLHVFRHGEYRVRLHSDIDFKITEPSILYCPKPLQHSIQPDNKTTDHTDGELLCAAITLGDDPMSQATNSLPSYVVLPLESMKSLDQTLALLFNEATGDRCGKQLAQDRLAEYFMVLLLRELIEQNAVNAGLLAGLGDKRLVKTILAIQAQPEAAWSIDSMATTAGMSRARFAAHFKQTLGQTPHHFLTDWRLGLAQNRLRKGEPIQTLFASVGYSQPAAFTRAFQQRLGMSPRSWLKQNQS